MKRLHPLWTRLWPMGTRLQLTCWFTCILALIIVCAGTVVYKYLEISLESSFDTTLALQARLISSEISFTDHQLQISDRTGDIPSLAATRADPRSIPADVTNGLLVRVLDMQGHVVRESPGFRLYPLPASLLVPLSQQTINRQTLTVKSSDLEIRVYSQVLTSQGKPYAIIQVGESLAQMHSVLRNTAFVLLLLTPILLALSAVGSYWLAARAFAPIHQLTTTAREIHSHDLHQRVPLPRAHDEVYFLATTVNAMIARLEDAFTRQRRFVADASHELRTPLAAIVSKTDVALLQPLDSQAYIGILQQINTESLRLGDLIKDLLALARADEGQLHLIYEPVRLDLLVEAVLATATELAEARQITLQMEHVVPVEVSGDEARLMQVIINLVDNALTYTPPHGHVTLRVRHEGTQGLVIVQDTGKGIAPEHLPHIFERFYRVDSARSRDMSTGRGSGLGLAIVDWIVQAHGGRVTVESRLDQGSIFTLSLPFQPSS